ncbi:hypothetical protein ACA910_008045 [Epithemia clementina (nom. ined.)]
MDLFSKNPSSNLRVRSEAYVASMIETGSGIVVERSGMVAAYAEVSVHQEEGGIKEFLQRSFQWNSYRFRTGDLLVYWAGLVRNSSKVRGWRNMCCAFVEHHYFAEERKIRKAWQEGSILIRPRRVIFACGTTSHGGYGLKVLASLIGNVFPGDEGPSHKEFITCAMNDGSGRTGVLNVLYIDPPLTPLQSERTKRNRYLINELEQRRLLNTRIGIVGLSTGSVALEALLREGIGGIYRLADFDIFEMSNSNRMIFGNQDTGRSKLSLCVERIRSVDPTIRVEEFPAGLNSENVAAFVKNCDLIIEECDDFPVKMLVRQAAKEQRVPVLMATSQNGMIDVERYDNDENCLPFHMTTKPLDVRKLQGVESDGTDKQKEKIAEVALSLYDSRQISPRMLVSLTQMGKSVASFPQLAEEVFLNAATLAHAARRILTGDKSVVSGRFSVQMDRLFTAYNRIPTQTPSMDPSKGLALHPRPPFSMEPGLEDQLKKLLFVIYWARMAPNGGNAQPWDTSLVVKSGVTSPCLEISFREGAKSHRLEFYHSWYELGLGCLLENAEIAAAHLGMILLMIGDQKINTSSNAHVAARFILEQTPDDSNEPKLEKKRLFHAMSIRSSVRTTRPWTKGLPDKLISRLDELGVRLVKNPKHCDVIRRALVQERGRRFINSRDRKELLSEIGEDALKLHPKLLGLSANDQKVLKIMEQAPQAIDYMVELGLEKELLDPLVKDVNRIPMFLVLRDQTGVADNVEKGRLLETVWLEIVYHGLAARPWGLLDPANLQSIGVPGAFFILVIVEPCSLGLCSSRL